MDRKRFSDKTKKKNKVKVRVESEPAKNTLGSEIRSASYTLDMESQ